MQKWMKMLAVVGNVYFYVRIYDDGWTKELGSVGDYRGCRGGSSRTAFQLTIGVRLFIPMVKSRRRNKCNNAVTSSRHL